MARTYQGPRDRLWFDRSFEWVGTLKPKATRRR